VAVYYLLALMGHLKDHLMLRIFYLLNRLSLKMPFLIIKIIFA
jgi:hypothetical protein